MKDMRVHLIPRLMRDAGKMTALVNNSNMVQNHDLFVWLQEWLNSIPTYPKAFKFLMGSITDLLDFRANDLFPDEKINWECETKSLKVDGKSQRSYYVLNSKRIYCDFSNRDEMEVSLHRKRVSLKRAIEVYMEEVS